MKRCERIANSLACVKCHYQIYYGDLFACLNADFRNLHIREREADIAEQTTKMHVIEKDMELVSKAFSEQRLQIQTLKMENDQLRAQASSARSAHESQEASNATKGLEPMYMFNTEHYHYQAMQAQRLENSYIQWLAELGIDKGLAVRLAKRLIEEDIDLHTLLELGPADFERLGVLKVLFSLLYSSVLPTSQVLSVTELLCTSTLQVGWQKKLVRKARESLSAFAGIGDG